MKQTKITETMTSPTFQINYTTLKNVSKKEYWVDAITIETHSENSAREIFTLMFQPDIKKFHKIKSIVRVENI